MVWDFPSRSTCAVLQDKTDDHEIGELPEKHPTGPRPAALLLDRVRAVGFEAFFGLLMIEALFGGDLEPYGGLPGFKKMPGRRRRLSTLILLLLGQGSISCKAGVASISVCIVTVISLKK